MRTTHTLKKMKEEKTIFLSLILKNQVMLLSQKLVSNHLTLCEDPIARKNSQFVSETINDIETDTPRRRFKSLNCKCVNTCLNVFGDYDLDQTPLVKELQSSDIHRLQAPVAK